MTLSPIKSIHIEHCDVVMRSDGIVQLNATDHEYEADDIKRIHVAIKEITNGKKVKVILSASKLTSITPEARKYVSTPEANLHTSANAFVTQSLPQRILVNFMIRVQGRPVPTRFFTSVESAADWLNKLKS